MSAETPLLMYISLEPPGSGDMDEVSIREDNDDGPEVRSKFRSRVECVNDRLRCTEMFFLIRASAYVKGPVVKDSQGSCYHRRGNVSSVGNTAILPRVSPSWDSLRADRCLFPIYPGDGGSLA